MSDFSSHAASFGAPPPGRGSDRLRRITEVLGCSVSDFFDPPATRSDLAGAAELLVLWSAISDEAGRARLLACARDAARASNGRAVAGSVAAG